MENRHLANCAEHCPMYLALEMLSNVSGIKIMVLGTRECVFYSFKYRTKADLKDFCAYEITDREMVLGDLSEVERAVEEFCEPGKKTLVIATCVPTLLSLETGCVSVEIMLLLLPRRLSFSMSNFMIRSRRA